MPRRGRGSSLHALLPAGCPPPGPYVALGTWKTRMPPAWLWYQTWIQGFSRRDRKGV